MRSRAPAHAVAVAALLVAELGARAQPATPGFGADLEPAPAPPGLAAKVLEPQPASPAAVDARAEDIDVPEWGPPPDLFAVVPFENRAGVRAFDWLVAAAPFEIATKTERVLGLEPAAAPLFVGPRSIAPTPGAIAGFAGTQGVRWVVTGWVERPNWELKLAIALWRVDAGVATLVHESVRQGPVATYHAVLGQALGEVWSRAGRTIDADRQGKLEQALAIDPYAITLLGRGLGHFVGALPAPAQPADPALQRQAQLKIAEHDLERSVFIDPKCHEAQRLVGEIYLALAPIRNEPKLASRAAGKFAYAHDLSPTDPQALQAAARAAAQAGKHEVARELFTKVVKQRRWDVQARYQLGAALWQTGRVAQAERQLQIVTARNQNHLAARRVLVLIHASRSDTPRLITELESIAARVPTDLEVKADLASAYGAIGRWDRATSQLEAIAASSTPDLGLLVRIGDGHRRQDDVDGALAWYARAQRAHPEASLPGFMIAQAQLDAGRLVEAARTLTLLQKYRDELGSIDQSLGVIALAQGRANDAAWYLRRAVRQAPRVVENWRAMIAAELARKDAAAALVAVERARSWWPRDGHLAYLAGVAHALAGQRDEARASLVAALELAPDLVPARTALGVLDAGGTVTPAYVPDVARPWGDAVALAAMLARFGDVQREMAVVRLTHETQVLTLLGALHKGPFHPVKSPQLRTCPLGRVGPLWGSAQQHLRRYERLGVDLEAAYRYLARHEELGLTAGLLPNARMELIAAKKAFHTALADVGELRQQWARGIGPELKAAGCTDRLLVAAARDPARYRVIVEDTASATPVKAAPRPRPRATFYVDNTACADPVDVWIDGSQLGEVAPGRRSALVADGGERTLCLLPPGSAQCGDRGTVRQVYLHDGWNVKLHCPRADSSSSPRPR